MGFLCEGKHQRFHISCSLTAVLSLGRQVLWKETGS